MANKFGPGLLVTAAFIGPGTVTTASVTGAGYGFALLWTLSFSILATIALQEMSARLGLTTGRGLAEALRTSFDSPLGKTATIALVVCAVGFGNCAFETGNIAGAAIGMEVLTGVSDNVWAVLVGVVSFALLASRSFRSSALRGQLLGWVGRAKLANENSWSATFFFLREDSKEAGGRAGAMQPLPS